jgi:aminobenzoyl-glutamate utilization protein B
LIEFKSSALLAEELERNGFKVERGVAGMPTAFIASWGSSKPVIGILGEYDALPGLSQKKVPFKDPLDIGKPGHVNVNSSVSRERIRKDQIFPRRSRRQRR